MTSSAPAHASHIRIRICARMSGLAFRERRRLRWRSLVRVRRPTRGHPAPESTNGSLPLDSRATD